MKFTDEDKLKLTSNVAEMIAYIKENIQPRVNGKIEIHFGSRHTSARTGRSTEAYHMEVTSDTIRYAAKFGSYCNFVTDAVIAYPDEMLDFVKNWQEVKSRLHTAVANQEDDRKAIYDFKV